MDNLLAFEVYAKQRAEDLFSSNHSYGEKNLKEAIFYSLFSGGKRFRPLLCVAVAEACGYLPKSVYAWALSIEMIHTYSLIHDDLPAMDNDDFRRGKPTNHKVYQEDFAILAGDALLTEAFELIAEHSYLVRLLTRASGFRGMLGGQAIDLRSQNEKLDLEKIEILHRKKTGALLAASVCGSAYLCGVQSSELETYYKFGEDLGYLFQVQDDIFDYLEKGEKEKNVCHLLGEARAKEVLQSGTLNLIKLSNKLFSQPKTVEDIILYNQNRTH